MRPILLIFKALQAGERWITVRPNGPDAKGQPVLIQPQPDGSAKVVGGAGGSLNHLRLTGVRPQSELKQHIQERAAARRDARKKQQARDKELGLQGKKAEAYRKVKEQKRKASTEFVAGVAEQMGWKPEEYQFDESKVTKVDPKVADKLRMAHEVEMVQRAKQAVKLNRERMLSDADARAEAELGEIPITSTDPATLSVQDIDPVRPAGGLGFAPEYKERAENAGLKEAEFNSEAAAAKKELTPEQRKAAIARGETAKLVKDTLQSIREDGVDEKLAPKLVAAKKALELMKLEKKLKIAQQQAAKAHKEIAESVVEPKAYVIEVEDAEVDKQLETEVANDLRTVRTRAFLAEAKKDVADPVKALSRHINAGAFNSVNALALAAGGSALIDRSVVDVLGIAGAAEVLAQRLKTDLSPSEMKQVAEGVEAFHLQNYMEVSDEAIRRARELRAQAAEIELGTAENGDDLAALQEINRTRGEAVAEAQRVLGQAMGEMEANAALVLALKGGKSTKPLQVSLGNTPVEDAIRQLRAIGLQRGEYTLDTVAGNRVASVTPEGVSRLAAPVNRADLMQVRRNLDIINGKYDEQGWMPEGIVDRPDLDLHPKAGVAPQLAEPFAAGPDLARSIADYAGGRAADGDAAADIIADLQSAEMMSRAGDGRAEEYLQSLNKLLPLWDEQGKMRPAEALQPELDRMADEFVSSRYGDVRSSIQRQTFEIDDKSTEALHRALSAEPTGVAAYKPIGEMTPQDQGAIREFFAEHVAKESPEAKSMRHDLDKLIAQEPERQATDMFGDTVTNPEWTDWKRRRDELGAKVNAASMTWAKYVDGMHGQVNAYAAMQDLVRSRTAEQFAKAYNTINPSAPLKLGRAVIRNNLHHLDAVDPKAREARMAKERAVIDRLRERAQGRYAVGSVRGKLDAIREQQAGFDAAQMGFFASEGGEHPLEQDERYTVGHEAERRIAAMMPVVGQNFRAGQPVRLIRPEMSGGKNAPRQRAIKLIAANKRVALSFGVGSGKTLIGLAGFTNLQQKGKAKRGLFAVPSIVQGQYNGEALRFLKPGTFKWSAHPGASRDERIAAYKDQGNNFCVMTHQAIRDDMVHLGAKHAGVSEDEMSARLRDMSRGERKEWMRGLMRTEGMNFDYMNVDEGHNLLNREGKENSELANVLDAISDNANYYVSASADPIKNDSSEAFSLLQKMDPDRYTDRDAFMRRYGVDTIAAKDGLRREMARFQYPFRIDPDITATRKEHKVTLSGEQQKALTDLERTSADIRLARMRGDVDMAAVKKLSPHSFVDVPADQQETVARGLQDSLGIMKESATRAILNGGAKVDAISSLVGERRGKPGVVFAHSLAAVEAVGKRLSEDGYRVVTITGKDGSKAKAAKGRMFNPQVGDAKADVLVASDAAATGLNAQRGQYVINLDTPDTAKTHAQRNGRVDRIGQQHDVELIDLVADHPDEARARKRLKNKYALRDLMTSPMEGLDDTGLAYFLKQRQTERVAA